MSADELRELDAIIAEHVMGYKWIAFDASTFKHGGKGAEFCTLEIPSESLLRQGGKMVEVPISDFERDIGGVPKYSTDPAAAMQVLEKCAQKCTEQWDVHRPDATLILHAPHPEWDNKWVIMSDIEGTITATAETLSLTICQFAKQIFSK